MATKPAPKKTAGANVASTGTLSPAPNDDWQTREDLRTLHQAHQIRGNPKRHAAVKAMAQQMVQAVKAAKPVAPMPAMQPADMPPQA